jgi:elongation factor G
MKTYEPKNIRNLIVVGHQGSGKTTLMESLLYISEVTKRKGSIEEETTTSDFTKEEKAKHMSIRSSLIPIEYKDIKYNFIDVPGTFDFIGETLSAIEAVDGAILLIDGTKGIEPGTKKFWKYLQKHKLSTLLLVTKMDKDNIDFEKVLEGIRKNLGKNAVPLSYPIGKSDKFEGFINVVEQNARIFNGTTVTTEEVWPEKLAKVANLRAQLVESVANIDDALLEKYLLEEEITTPEIKVTLKKGVKEGILTPILVSSAIKDVGIITLLDMIRSFLPSPIEVTRLRPIGESEPLSAYVWKTDVDPFVGKISYVVVRGGSLKKGQQILNATQQAKDVIGNVLLLRGKEQIETPVLTVGDIGAVTKTNSLETGDSISGEKDSHTYSGVETYPPFIYFAISVKSKNDESKISDALKKIALEDLTITIERNVESKQLIIGLQGQAHLDYVVEKLKNIYNIEVNSGVAKIPYRETIKGKSEKEGRYVKQSGGSGQYGIVVMKFEHNAEKEAPEFVDAIFGGSVPSNYIPAVEKGFRESCLKGVLGGYPVINIKATLLDGKYHPVDSSELAFKMAAIFSFKDACPLAKPTILEPIYKVHVSTPNDYVGAIIGDLNKRRGLIEGIEVVSEDEQQVVAQVPQAELATYILDLNALTQAQASYTMEFVQYQEVPEANQKKIIEEAARDNKERE